MEITTVPATLDAEITMDFKAGTPGASIGYPSQTS